MNRRQFLRTGAAGLGAAVAAVWVPQVRPWAAWGWAPYAAAVLLTHPPLVAAEQAGALLHGRVEIAACLSNNSSSGAYPVLRRTWTPCFRATTREKTP